MSDYDQRHARLEAGTSWGQAQNAFIRLGHRRVPRRDTTWLADPQARTR